MTATTTSLAGNPAMTAEETRQSQPNGLKTGSTTRPIRPR